MSCSVYPAETTRVGSCSMTVVPNLWVTDTGNPVASAEPLLRVEAAEPAARGAECCPIARGGRTARGDQQAEPESGGGGQRDVAGALPRRSQRQEEG